MSQPWLYYVIWLYKNIEMLLVYTSYKMVNTIYFAICFIGKIFEPRLVMEFSGFHRGFGFFEFSTKAEATRATELMNECELRPRHCICCVVKSFDNCRFSMGNLPKDKSADEINLKLCD